MGQKKLSNKYKEIWIYIYVMILVIAFSMGFSFTLHTILNSPPEIMKRTLTSSFIIPFIATPIVLWFMRRKTAQILRLEKKISIEQQKLKNLIDHSPGIQLMSTNKGMITYVSQSVRKILGYTPEDLTNQNLLSLVPIAETENAIKLLEQENDESGKIFHSKLKLNHKDGRERLFQVSSSYLEIEQGLHGVILSLADITTATEHEKKQERKNKLTSLTTLSDTLYQEVENHTHLILMQLEQAQKRLKEDSTELAAINSAAKSVKQLIAYNKRLQAFSKKETLKLEPTDIGSFIQNEVRSFNIFPHVNLHVEGEYDLPQIQIDRDKIKKVLINIFENSVEAMADHGEVNITVRRSKSESTSHQDGVIITFSDTGKGIPQEAMEQIFDPFYTSSPTNVGLGLTHVHNYVTQHNGFVNIKSSQTGTIVSIFLPYSGQSTLTESKKLTLYSQDEFVTDFLSKVCQNLSLHFVCKENVSEIYSDKSEFALIDSDSIWDKISDEQLETFFSKLNSDALRIILTQDTDHIQLFEQHNCYILKKPLDVEKLQKILQG